MVGGGRGVFVMDRRTWRMFPIHRTMHFFYEWKGVETLKGHSWV